MKFKNINSYSQQFGFADRKLLKELIAIVKKVGKFEETISYNMPAFRYNTKIICCFAIAKNHLGFYPYSGNILNLFPKELEKYKTSKGAVQFPKDKKIPEIIIKKILKARIKEINNYENNS
jgi:uncharacterized protein YdhG (YjbR/CyaY superfamily)